MVIHAAVHIHGSDVRIDLEGSSDLVEWGCNVVHNFNDDYSFL